MHDVLLAFRAHDASLLGALPSLQPHEIVEARRLGADEALLEIGVDHGSGLWCGIAAMNRPGAHLLLTGREVRVQAEQVVARVDQSIQSRALESQRRQELGLVLRRQLGQLGFDACGEGHDIGDLVACSNRHPQGIDVLAVPGCQFVIGDVGCVQHRLHRQQHQRLEQQQLVLRQIGATNRQPVLQRSQCLRQRRQLGDCFLVAALRDALLLVESFLDAGDVGEAQLEIDHVAIAHRVHAAHHVGDVVVVEAADHVHDRIRLADVGEELVAQPFTLCGTLHQARDVHELHHGRHGALGLHDDGQCGEPSIRHLDHADVGLDGAERIIRRLGLGRGQRIEERGLADVREADDAELQHVMDRKEEEERSTRLTRPG